MDKIDLLSKEFHFLSYLKGEYSNCIEKKNITILFLIDDYIKGYLTKEESQEVLSILIPLGLNKFYIESIKHHISHPADTREFYCE